MSKIGKLPVRLPEGVKTEVLGQTLTVSGPKGAVSRRFPKEVGVEVKDGSLRVLLKGKPTKERKALFGTTRALVANMVSGATEGWMKELELVGAGFRAEILGNTLVLTVGYSRPVKIEAPPGISFRVEKTTVRVEGIDKELVGKIAADIRAVRPPEPYKGKGIKYQDEKIRKKPGKAAAKGVVA